MTDSINSYAGLQANKVLSSFMVKQDTIKFLLDEDQLSNLLDLKYFSIQSALTTELPFSKDEFREYHLNLIRLRLSQLNGGNIQYHRVKELRMISVIEAVLNHIGEHYAKDLGLKAQWAKGNDLTMGIDDMNIFSFKLQMISKLNNDIVSGYPRDISLDKDIMMSIEDEIVVSIQSVDAQTIGISALLNQRISDNGYSTLFRKILCDRSYAVREVTNANIG